MEKTITVKSLIIAKLINNISSPELYYYLLWTCIIYLLHTDITQRIIGCHYSYYYYASQSYTCWVTFKLANLISKLNFYKLIPYPMDNCFTGRRDRSRQTPEKDVLYILPAGPVTERAFARWRIVLHFLFTY